MTIGPSAFQIPPGWKIYINESIAKTENLNVKTPRLKENEISNTKSSFFVLDNAKKEIDLKKILVTCAFALETPFLQ